MRAGAVHEWTVTRGPAGAVWTIRDTTLGPVRAALAVPLHALRVPQARQAGVDRVVDFRAGRRGA